VICTKEVSIVDKRKAPLTRRGFLNSDEKRCLAAKGLFNLFLDSSNHCTVAKARVRQIDGELGSARVSAV
jgi:hypothetical protein